MQKNTSLLLCLIFSVITLQAQNKKELDKNSIKEMCGCYEVSFNFAETFNYSTDSLYKPSPQEISRGLEWAELLEDKDDKIVIQHLLQVGTKEGPYIVKHWRQDWLYENTEFYAYDAANTWKYIDKPASEVEGQWTQKVFQVDDSPRYEGSGSWVHVDGKHYWESTSDAPLPRREDTKRSDYNVTVRGNRVELADFGWIHDQDNGKVVREAGKEDILVAKEKGYNTYVKVDDSRCEASREWWKEHNEKWALVRAKWETVFNRDHDLTLKEKVSNKSMFKFLLDEEEYSEKTAIDGVIDSFIEQ